MVLADIERLAGLPYGTSVYDMKEEVPARIGEKIAVTRFDDYWELTVGRTETHSTTAHIWRYGGQWVHKHNGEPVSVWLSEHLDRVGPWRDVPDVGSKHALGDRVFDLIGFDETDGDFILHDGAAYRVVTAAAYQRDFSPVTTQSAIDALQGPQWAIDFIKGKLA
jgi:hypothetical protein